VGVSWDAPIWLVPAAICALTFPLAVWRGRWQRLEAERIASARLWRRWLGGRPATGTLRLSLWLLAAALASAAAAGPRWGTAPASLPPGVHVAIAADVSASMNATDVLPSRLRRALAVLRSTVTMLPSADWSLTVGGGNAIPVIPLSADRELLLADLDRPDWAAAVTPGSNLAVLLATAAAQLPTQGPGRIVLLLSDGEQLDGDARAVAEELRARGIAVLALRSGTTSGGPVPARSSDGKTSYLRDRGDRVVYSAAHPGLLAALAGTRPVIDSRDAGAANDLAREIVAAATGGGNVSPQHSRLFVLAAAVAGTVSFFLWPWRLPAGALALALVPVVADAAGPQATPPLQHVRWFPGAVTVWTLQGEAAARKQDWATARAAFARALSRSAGDARLEIAWATAAALDGEPDGDAALDRRCAGRELAFDACYNLGTVRLVRGSAADAIRPLLRALRLRPGSTETWRNLELARLRAAHKAETATARAEAATAPLDELLATAARRALAVPPPPPATGDTEPTERPW
jgi:Ca-activated chloride channel family protein